MCVSIHLPMRTCIHDKYAEQGRIVYLWSSNVYLYTQARVSVGAHKLHTHTHAFANACARAHACARTHAHTHARA